MTVWFTSDTHFGHANVIRYCDRPFKTADEMDETIIRNWNAVVAPGDLVYHAGDFSFHRPERSRGIISRLHGQKFLVRGNHDREQFVKACGDQFVWIRDYHSFSVEGQKIVICHFPFLTWDKSHHGSWNLHGHCHGNLADDPNSLRIDIGVDCHSFVPISFEQVKALMAKKQFKPIDHHGRAD